MFTLFINFKSTISYYFLHLIFFFTSLDTFEHLVFLIKKIEMPIADTLKPFAPKRAPIQNSIAIITNFHFLLIAEKQIINTTGKSYSRTFI